jgi:mRNA-degrading endonuclease RelE of RelBE toxin-antitoxin system
MTYTVRLKPRAERELDRLPIAVARRIWEKPHP